MPPQAIDQDYAYFVDCGVSVNRPVPSNVIDALDHLEGQTVSIMADGAVLPQQVVQSGRVTLPEPARIVHAGLPIDAHIRTLPVVLPAGDPAYGQGRTKNVNKVWLRVHRSAGILAGPSLDAMQAFKQRTDEPYGSPPELVSREIEVPLEPGWAQGGGQVYVQVTDPLPLEILSMTAEVVLGG